MDKETTTQVTPGGQVPLEDVAAALIRLADHPHDVVWASRGGYFVVPEEVAVRYAAEQADTLAAAAAENGTAVQPKPAARQRKRPAAKATPAKATAAAKETPPAAEKTAGRRSRSSRSKKKGGES